MSNLLGHSKLFLNRNASTILTCIGSIGVVATSVMAVKATPKALALLEEAKAERNGELTKAEIIITAGPAYIPTIITGVTTIACIFGANALNKRQQAALMSAYALLDNSYKEYRSKVDELYGEEAGRKVREEIAKDSYDEHEVQIEEGKQLFYDFYSDRYFESTLFEVQKAEYQVNRNLTMRDYTLLNEFYHDLGLDPIDGGYSLGWSTGACFAMYWQNWIDFSHEKAVLDDGLECIIIKFVHDPIIGFADYC